jgi:release factor glutamine methyltransferase
VKETVTALLTRATGELAAAGVEAREARWLLGHVLGWSEAQVLGRGEYPVAPEAAGRFRDWVARRVGGEPFAYVIGEREFYGRPFSVDRRVLIPRPETEHVVEAALALELPAAPRFLDVGTGSGCLAITLVLERPRGHAVATDTSLGALAVASSNALRLGASSRVQFVACDLATAVDLAAFDCVVSNPPYVATLDAPALSREVRDHEPAAALFAGTEGLDAIRRLLADLAQLRPGTPLVLEVGAGQAAAVESLLAAYGFAHAATLPDAAGIARVVIGTRSPWSASRSRARPDS